MNLHLLKKRILDFSSKRENLIISGVFFLILFIFLTNTIHESYPDEFDNIMGGWLTLQGKMIYIGWFTHHAPFAYWLASFIEIFSGQSFVKFRLFYSIFLTLLTFGGFLYLKKSFGFAKTWFYLGFLILFGISATYFWAHMLLADSLAAILLVPVFGLLVLKMYYSQELKIKDFIFISVFLSLALLTAMTFTYLIAGVYGFALLYYFFKPKRKRILDINHLKVFIIIVLPFLIFLLYLLVTRSFGEFFYHAITFNQQFYIYNYPKPEDQTFINPVRFAIVIAHDFYNNFSSLLIQSKEFNFLFPFNITLAVVNTGFIIFLLIKRKFMLALFVLFWLIYSNARSNPLTSKETDYQSAVYIIASLFNILFALTVIYEDLKKSVDYPKKLIISLIFLVMLIYSFFNFTYLLRSYSHKVYGKYMGTAPLIYDRPVLAPVLEGITNEEDVVWVGPFEFEELFYLDRDLPSRYVILLPEFARAPRIREEMMRDFKENPPKVIYFDMQYSIRGNRPEEFAPFFMNFLSENYVTLDSFDGTGGSFYTKNLPRDHHFDFETKLFIRKDSVGEVMNKLIEKGFVTKTE
jgi:hypothetical protein